jgi:hypothetical protein
VLVEGEVVQVFSDAGSSAFALGWQTNSALDPDRTGDNRLDFLGKCAGLVGTPDGLTIVSQDRTSSVSYVICFLARPEQGLLTAGHFQVQRQ